MNQNDPVAAQARLDKLMARIAFLETTNQELRSSLADTESRMEEKEKQLREAAAVIDAMHAGNVVASKALDSVTADKAALLEHMAELRQILMRDNDAQTVLDALRLLCRVTEK